MVVRRRNASSRFCCCLAAWAACTTLVHQTYADSWVVFEEQSNSRMIADLDIAPGIKVTLESATEIGLGSPRVAQA